MSATPHLVLASRSPQRRAILEQLGVSFRVEVPEVQEATDLPPAELVRENAQLKAAAVVSDLPVMGADTTVDVDGVAYGKPAGREEAREAIELLSGREHVVRSAVAIAGGGSMRVAVGSTSVRFRSLGRSEVDWYLETGEWRERAGSYAIQGRGAALVARIEGDYATVVGLPVPEFCGLAPDLIFPAA